MLLKNIQIKSSFVDKFFPLDFISTRNTQRSEMFLKTGIWTELMYSFIDWLTVLYQDALDNSIHIIQKQGVGRYSEKRGKISVNTSSTFRRFSVLFVFMRIRGIKSILIKIMLMLSPIP
jgi:hypothetical protein